MMPPMTYKLFAVAGSHPCAAVQRALDDKGVAYTRIDLPQGLHFAHQAVRFGGRPTVPGLLGDGIRVSGSRAIMRVLEGIAPDPSLYADDPGQRAREDEAERWGDEVLQAGVRRIAWGIIPRNPRAAVSFLEGSPLPLPPALAARTIPLVVPLERRANRVSDETLGQDLAALPGWLDRVDSWLEDGTLDARDSPSAADLQIASSVRFAGCFGDLDGALDGRPAVGWAHRLFPAYPGRIPEGALPYPPG